MMMLSGSKRGMLRGDGYGWCIRQWRKVSQRGLSADHKNVNTNGRGTTVINEEVNKFSIIGR